MLTNFRDTLSFYEKRGQLTRVKKEVDREFEVAALLAHFEDKSAILCEKVKGYDIPVAGNIFYSREQIAAGLGVSIDNLQSKLVSAITNGISPHFVEEAPCQEVVVNNPVILEQLPIPRFFERETGPYISAGLIIAKNPVTGKRNISIARCKVLDGNRIMLGIAPNHHLSRLLRESLELGKPLEAAISIGNCPAMMMASNFYVDYGHDEYDIAGALLGEPIDIVKCKNLELEVPAQCEIVIEGRIKDEYIEEGPVSEFPGMYVNYGKGVIMEVSCITRRKDAIFQAILPGYYTEHLLIGGEAIAATLFYNIKKVVPHVCAVSVPLSGAGRLQAVASFHNPRPGDGHRAMFAAFSHCSLVKHFVAVDDDIDVNDAKQVLWAIATRMRGSEDIVIIPGVRADRAEPLENNGTVTKVGVMAIKQKHGSRQDFTMCRVPKEVMNKIENNLDNYIKGY
jgi:2,5-furandicarboxylate decarboxylase 1